MGKVKMTAKVVSQQALTDDIFSMWIQADEIAGAAVPGQFISVYTKDAGKLLPRPISLCQVDKEKGQLRIVYRVVGAGTSSFPDIRLGMILKLWVLWAMASRWSGLPARKYFSLAEVSEFLPCWSWQGSWTARSRQF